MGLGSALTVLLFSAFSQVINAHCDSILNFNQIESKRKGVEECKLYHYSDRDIVKCLDNIPRHVTDDAVKLNQTKLYFLFVGDSRTRSHFTSFIRSFPDYDFLWSEFHLTGAFHSDVDVDSEILNIRISFRWRPLLSEPVTQELGKLTFQTPTPVFVLIGISLWHMLPRYDGFDDGQVYRRMLNLLKPQLRTISKSTTLIWLGQPPLGNGDYDKFESEIGSVASGWKIDQYNLVARRILGDMVTFWDSALPLADEYISSCSFNYRIDRVSYINCDDDVHFGYSMICHANQILLNYLCSSF